MRPLPDGQWWSDINPAAQRLARRRILASNDGAAAWDSIAAAGDRPPFSVHLWVAGREGTVCAWEGPGGVNDMAARLLRGNGGGGVGWIRGICCRVCCSGPGQ